MSDLPSGLASISSQFDDTPQVRGAVAFGRMVREREEASAETVTMTFDEMPVCTAWPIRWITREEAVEIYGEPDPLGSAIDRHAALTISAGYRSADRR